MPRLRFFFLGSVLAGVGACTYDWTIGATPLTEPGDSGAPDVTTDATGSGDAGPDDAAFDAARPTPDATTDDAADAGGPTLCATLAATLTSERGPAKRCTFGAASQCDTDITDECNCPSYLGTASSGPALAYTASVAQYKEAGCPLPGWCVSCVSPSPSCILDGDAGAVCFP
jgi:hypothetical protein